MNLPQSIMTRSFGINPRKLLQWIRVERPSWSIDCLETKFRLSSNMTQRKRKKWKKKEKGNSDGIILCNHVASRKCWDARPSCDPHVLYLRYPWYMCYIPWDIPALPLIHVLHSMRYTCITPDTCATFHEIYMHYPWYMCYIPWDIPALPLIHVLHSMRYTCITPDTCATFHEITQHKNASNHHANLPLEMYSFTL